MKILITAGPTREPIDPVRYLSNRSSGRMGYALAAAARARGHEVILISGPVSLTAPDGVDVIRIETAREMYGAVSSRITGVSVAIMSAAVADYAPRTVFPHKIKKGDADKLALELERTPDILGSVRSIMKFNGYLVGFAAETEHLLERAREKLHRKGCDLVVANDVGRDDIGFDRDENEVTLLFRDGRECALPKTTKLALAEEIVDMIEKNAPVVPAAAPSSRRTTRTSFTTL